MNRVKMSASIWDWPLALAEGQLLTNDECYVLLDTDFSDDLLKTFPDAAPKFEAGVVGEIVNDLPHAHDDTLYPASPRELKPNRAQLASDLLQQLDTQCKQENIFSNWLEEKVELPIFDGVNHAAERAEIAPVAIASVAALPALTYAPQPTEELLREFETVYGAVELTHLTPPQSPPGPATQLLLSYAQQAQCPPPAPAPPAPPAQPEPANWHLHYPDFQAVEELMRTQLASPLPSSASASASESPASSPPSSPRSSDEDWSVGGHRERPKPYSRSTDERRSRKKEQNKNAATRYRQKKKAEVEVLLGEEQALRQRHSDLGNKRADLQREIRYLKGLMRELFKAKGLIK